MKRLSRSFATLTVAATLWTSLTGGASAFDPKQPLPQFSEVKQTVLRYFQKESDYKPGDFVTRQQVEPLLARLQRLGFPASEIADIGRKLVGKDEFLAVQFATPGGKIFMRQIAQYPGAYDRLDRLSQLPHGQQTIRDLIRGPGGERLLEYMTKTKGGKALGEMLANSPNANDFNAPTGRIYSVESLLRRLEDVHSRATKATPKQVRR